MSRIFKKYEDLYSTFSQVKLNNFLWGKLYAFWCFFYLQICINQIYMQMFEYESLYNTKMFGKTFHIRRWKCAMFPKLKGTPPLPNNTVFLFFFILLNFKKANILHNYLIYLYSRICSLNRYWYIIRTFSKLSYTNFDISHSKFVYHNYCHIQILDEKY